MNIFRKTCDLLRHNVSPVMATILTAWGSTPVPAQGRMLIWHDRGLKSAGSIGGGCLDGQLLSMAAENRITSPHILTYRLNNDLGDTGLTCGGTINVLAEQIDTAWLPVYESIVAMHDADRDCILVTSLPREGNGMKGLYTTSGELAAGSALCTPDIHHLVCDTPALQGTEVREKGTNRFVIESLESDPRVIIFGGGHVGKIVAQTAALAGFRVTVVDDRPEYANRERFPEAEKVICSPFELAVGQLGITGRTYVVIVTRGHRHDEQVLEQVLQHKTRYAGMIGSRRKARLSFDRLGKHGVSAEQLSRVHTPVGLAIGAQTAEEIGVSITAELIAVRRGASPASRRNQEIPAKRRTRRMNVNV